MNILGRTRNGFILEASDTEVALIRGYRNSSADGYRNPETGHEIEVEKFDKIAKFVRTLDESKLEFIKKQLQLAIDNIDETVDLAQSLTLFARLEEEDKKK